MPTASNESRSIMKKWFGDEIDESGPYNFLRSHGFTEKGGLLIKPTPSYTVSEYELECIIFLCDEWDFAFEEWEIKTA